MPDTRQRDEDMDSSESERRAGYFRGTGLSMRWSRDFRRAHVLGPEAEPDEPCRDATKDRAGIEEPYRERRPRRRALRERAEDHEVLHDDLQPLRDARRQLAPPLHGVQRRG